MRYAQYPLAVLVAAWVAMLFATPVTSISNLLWLASMDMPVSFGVVVSVLLKDLFRLGTILSILTLAGYAIAFPVAALINRRVKAQPQTAYALAGAVAMLAIMVLLVETTFGVQLIAGNRTFVGTLAHLVAGGIGGLAFARLVAQQRTATFAVRVLGAVPMLLMAWSAISWTLDPAAAALGFGIDFQVVSDLGRNSVIRDLTSFFWTNFSLMLLGICSLNFRWFWASSMLFGFALVFNLAANHVHGTGPSDALVFEIVLCLWTLALGFAVRRLARSA